MNTVSLDKVTGCLPELVQHALDGEAVFIGTGSQQVRLVPSPIIGVQRRAGSAAGQVWMADDFDSPLDDFAECGPLPQWPPAKLGAAEQARTVR